MCRHLWLLPLLHQSTQGRAEVGPELAGGKVGTLVRQATSHLFLLSPLQLPWGAAWGAQSHVGPATPGPDWGPDSAAAADAAGLCWVLRAAGRGGSECWLTPCPQRHRGLQVPRGALW